MPAPKINPDCKKINVPVRLPRYIVDHIDSIALPRADVIEQAMVGHYKLLKPGRFDKPRKRKR